MTCPHEEPCGRSLTAPELALAARTPPHRAPPTAGVQSALVTIGAAPGSLLGLGFGVLGAQVAPGPTPVHQEVRADSGGWTAGAQGRARPWGTRLRGSFSSQWPVVWRGLPGGKTCRGWAVAFPPENSGLPSQAALTQSSIHRSKGPDLPGRTVPPWQQLAPSLGLGAPVARPDHIAL